MAVSGPKAWCSQEEYFTANNAICASKTSGSWSLPSDQDISSVIFYGSRVRTKNRAFTIEPSSVVFQRTMWYCIRIYYSFYYHTIQTWIINIFFLSLRMIASLYQYISFMNIIIIILLYTRDKLMMLIFQLVTATESKFQNCIFLVVYILSRRVLARSTFARKVYLLKIACIKSFIGQRSLKIFPKATADKDVSNLYIFFYNSYHILFFARAILYLLLILNVPPINNYY